jgi:hypothetical protein
MKNVTLLQSLGTDTKHRTGTFSAEDEARRKATNPFFFSRRFPGFGIREAGTAGGKTIRWIVAS